MWPRGSMTHATATGMGPEGGGGRHGGAPRGGGYGVLETQRWNGVRVWSNETNAGLIERLAGGGSDDTIFGVFFCSIPWKGSG